MHLSLSLPASDSFFSPQLWRICSRPSCNHTKPAKSSKEQGAVQPVAVVNKHMVNSKHMVSSNLTASKRTAVNRRTRRAPGDTVAAATNRSTELDSNNNSSSLATPADIRRREAARVTGPRPWLAWSAQRVDTRPASTSTVASSSKRTVPHPQQLGQTPTRSPPCCRGVFKRCV